MEEQIIYKDFKANISKILLGFDKEELELLKSDIKKYRNEAEYSIENKYPAIWKLINAIEDI